MNYRDAILKVIEHEGGAKITNHASDRGGLTKFGISQRAYPLLDIASLTLEDAIQIYKRDYWDRIQGDKIKSQSVAFAIFDQAVNRGVSQAVKNAQKAVGVKDDGILGPVTLNAINGISESQFLKSFIEISKNAYQSIVSLNPSQEIFLKGWMNRLDKVSEYAMKNSGVIQGSIVGLVAIVAIFFLITMPKKA